MTRSLPAGCCAVLLAQGSARSTASHVPAQVLDLSSALGGAGARGAECLWAGPPCAHAARGRVTSLSSPQAWWSQAGAPSPVELGGWLVARVPGDGEVLGSS